MFGEHQSVVETKEFVETKSHKLLGIGDIGQTRWLSLESCVKKVLEHWEALCLYFTSVVNEKKDLSYTTDSILQGLSNKYLKAQLVNFKVSNCTA